MASIWNSNQRGWYKKKNKQMPDQKLMGLHLDEKLNHIDKNLNWVFSF